MIIDSSNITLSAQHQATERRQQRESLQLFEVDQRGQAVASVELSRDALQLSRQSSAKQSLAANAQALATAVEQRDPNLRQQLADATAAAAPETPVSALSIAAPTATPLNSSAESEANSPILEPRTQLIKSILERMLGRSIQIGVESAPSTKTEPLTPEQPPQPELAQATGPTRMGMRYQRHESVEEFEQTSFQAQGKVRTRDGREINFALDLSMSRQYLEQQSVVIEAGAKLKDPLVINFDGRAAELRTNRFAFDLDADGQLDQLHTLASHSGMLALDKNFDGQINDGRELFGALSGAGFAELALYDQDHNGFIDAADRVYDQLQVWIKDDQSNDQLLSLQALDIGALYLGSTDTPFDLKDSNNALQGRIRATGVYLSESGQAGTLQQLDLVT